MQGIRPLVEGERLQIYRGSLSQNFFKYKLDLVNFRAIEHYSLDWPIFLADTNL